MSNRQEYTQYRDLKIMGRVGKVVRAVELWAGYRWHAVSIVVSP